MGNWFSNLFVKIGVFIEACYGIVIPALYILSICNVYVGNESILEAMKEYNWIVIMGFIMLALCITFAITNLLDENCFLAQTTYWISFVVGLLFIVLAFSAIIQALVMLVKFILFLLVLIIVIVCLLLGGGEEIECICAPK